jgi:hypothetical protein
MKIIGPTIADVNFCTSPLIKLQSACDAGSLSSRELAVIQLIIAELGNALVHAALALTAPVCVLIGCEVRQVLAASKTHALISLHSAGAFFLSLPAVVKPQLALKAHRYLGLPEGLENEKKSWLRTQADKVQKVVCTKKFVAAALVTTLAVGVIAFQFRTPVPPPPPLEPSTLPLLTVISVSALAVLFPNQTRRFIGGTASILGAIGSHTVVPFISVIGFAGRPLLRYVIGPLVRAGIDVAEVGILGLIHGVSAVASGLGSMTRPLLRRVIVPLARRVIRGVGLTLVNAVDGIIRIAAPILSGMGNMLQAIGPSVAATVQHVGVALSPIMGRGLRAAGRVGMGVIDEVANMGSALLGEIRPVCVEVGRRAVAIAIPVINRSGQLLSDGAVQLFSGLLIHGGRLAVTAAGVCGPIFADLGLAIVRGGKNFAGRVFTAQLLHAGGAMLLEGVVKVTVGTARAVVNVVVGVARAVYNA